MELVFSNEIVYHAYNKFYKYSITLLYNGDLYLNVRLLNKNS